MIKGRSLHKRSWIMPQVLRSRKPLVGKLLRMGCRQSHPLTVLEFPMQMRRRQRGQRSKSPLPHPTRTRALQPQNQQIAPMLARQQPRPMQNPQLNYWELNHLTSLRRMLLLQNPLHSFRVSNLRQRNPARLPNWKMASLGKADIRKQEPVTWLLTFL